MMVRGNAYLLLTIVTVLLCVNFTAADQATVAMTLPAVSVQEDEQSTMFCAELTLTSGYTLETVIIAPFDEDTATTGRADDNSCVPKSTKC